jgi:hypothetical protein
VVGTLSEVFRPAFGEESLRWALGVGMTTIGLLSTLFFFLAARWQTTHPELSHPPQART